MRSKKLIAGLGLLLAVTALAACGGGGGGGSSLPPGGGGSGGTPTATPVPTPGVGSFNVQAAPTSIPMPGYAGFAGTLSMPGATGSGSVSVTVSSTAPSGVGIQAAAKRAAVMVAVAPSSPLLFVTLTPQNALVLHGAPGFAITVPLGTDSAASYLLERYSSGAWVTVAGPATLSGLSLTTAENDNAGDIALPAGRPTYFALFATGDAPYNVVLSAPLVMGSPGTVQVSVVGRIPGGSLTLSDGDASGHTSMATTTVTVSQSVPLIYDGHGDTFAIEGNAGGSITLAAFSSRLPIEKEILGYDQTANPIINQVVFNNFVLFGDGNFWGPAFGQMARVTPGAQFTAYTDPNVNHWQGSRAVVGSDGRLWTTFHDAELEGSGIDAYTTTGQVTSYSIRNAVSAYNDIGSMIDGPDGALWFSTDTGIGRIDTAGNASQVGTSFTSSSSDLPTNLVAGPDGNVWFALGANIERITPGGVVTAYTLPGAAAGGTSLKFILGPDGNFWVPYAYGSNRLLKVSTSGAVVSSTALPPTSQAPGAFTYVDDMVKDASGNVFVADSGSQGIIRITPSGQAVEYYTYSQLTYNEGLAPLHFAFGADGKLYMASTSVTGPAQSDINGALTPIDTSLW